MPQKLRVQPSVGEAAADSLTVVWSGGLTADAMKDVSHFSLQWRTLTAGDLADDRRAKLAALLADNVTVPTLVADDCEGLPCSPESAPTISECAPVPRPPS